MMYPVYLVFQKVANFRLIKDQNGVTAIEYGLIAALIAVVIIVGVTAVGTNLTGVFSKVAASVHS